jgi:SAM-dependent methyltransferase
MDAVTTSAGVDRQELEARIRAMYRAVADDPSGSYHFELGRSLAERLGYPAEMLDRLPAGAVDSFAGVGWFLDFAELTAGETVVDLGSGSGMDSFVAALLVGDAGRVIGVDMTPEQLAKARRLATHAGAANVRFVEGRIEELPFGDAEFDAVISNGVINLAPDKHRVFAEAARILRPGGRLGIADIVSRATLPDKIVCNAELWASCIGGASQVDAYRSAIEAAGLVVEVERPNPYAFLSSQARGASETYGVMSLSILARKPQR